jgi:hypothetical protein
VKKVTATMSLPYSMVAVMWRRRWQQTIFLFIFVGLYGLVYYNWQLTI